ncbi:hypothetical protein KSS87_022510, partial [Heliosperma pusillum]
MPMTTMDAKPMPMTLMDAKLITMTLVDIKLLKIMTNQSKDITHLQRIITGKEHKHHHRNKLPQKHHMNPSLK